MTSSKLFTYALFDALMDRVRRDGVCAWVDVEDEFMACMAAIDADFTAGNIKSGQRKAAARYFNDILGQLAANRTGLRISMRAKRDGLAIEKHDLDLCFPAERDAAPIAAAEVKIAGMPPHDGNLGTSGAKGRPVRQDLDKRIREIGFTSVDLKRRWSGDPTLTRLSDADPLYVAFYAARAADDGDLKGMIRRFEAIRDHYTDGVGVFIFRAPDAQAPTTYEKVDPGQGLRIDEVLERFCKRVSGS